MNSSLYRKQLILRFDKAKLSGQEMFMIFSLFSVIKNRDRVLKALKAMEEKHKEKTWYQKVKSFIPVRLGGQEDQEVLGGEHHLHETGLGPHVLDHVDGRGGSQVERTKDEGGALQEQRVRQVAPGPLLIGDPGAGEEGQRVPGGGDLGVDDLGSLDLGEDEEAESEPSRRDPGHEEAV
ncbi:hypothetical protein CDD81_7817 [Ophiocordyceps australis]|uniref:Uncharacterized protein n=1 Tax=Ophiocordyceps australis TaxID=1399860 RepID=A0A2C5YGW1_9HYPO|nr:hypothetical protein CDD81_7817 [Ophiocordyceps australis]